MKRLIMVLLFAISMTACQKLFQDEQPDETKPEIRSHKPEEFVDASFISELDRSGFIKRLYEPK